MGIEHRVHDFQETKNQVEAQHDLCAHMECSLCSASQWKLVSGSSDMGKSIINLSVST